jgi:hypothetical protein
MSVKYVDGKKGISQMSKQGHLGLPTRNGEGPTAGRVQRQNPAIPPENNDPWLAHGAAGHADPILLRHVRCH